MKRTFCLILALTLALALAPMGIAAGPREPGMDNFQPDPDREGGCPFTDLQGMWGAADIAEAYELGLVNGKSATEFTPGGEVSLVETIVFAVRLYNIYNGSRYILENAAAPDPWYRKYLSYAKNWDIIDHYYPDEEYNKPATRAQFAQIISRALPEAELAAINDVEYDSIPDVYESDEGSAPVYLLYRAGILNGDSTHSFNPDSTITRQEVAVMLLRMAKPERRVSVSLEYKPNGTLKRPYIGSQGCDLVWTAGFGAPERTIHFTVREYLHGDEALAVMNGNKANLPLPEGKEWRLYVFEIQLLKVTPHDGDYALVDSFDRETFFHSLFYYFPNGSKFKERLFTSPAASLTGTAYEQYMDPGNTIYFDKDILGKTLTIAYGFAADVDQETLYMCNDLNLGYGVDSGREPAYDWVILDE